MKGYIYTMFKGADPSKGWKMNDPMFGQTATMGACRPDIRRNVEVGDYIFPISGNIVNVKPHVVGAFAVDEKIDALIANSRFPENVLRKNADGTISGNIIVDADGNHIPDDYHDNFEGRIGNYIVGRDQIFFDTAPQMQLAKDETVQILNEIFGKKEDKVHKIIGRWRKMDARQIKDLLDWMEKIKQVQ